VLRLHGRGTDGHDLAAGFDDIPDIAAKIKKHNYDYSRQLIRQGYITVGPASRTR
jgi:hypothetical protein